MSVNQPLWCFAARDKTDKVSRRHSPGLFFLCEKASRRYLRSVLSSVSFPSLVGNWHSGWAKMTRREALVSFVMGFLFFYYVCFCCLSWSPSKCSNNSSKGGNNGGSSNNNNRKDNGAFAAVSVRHDAVDTTPLGQLRGWVACCLAAQYTVPG